MYIAVCVAASTHTLYRSRVLQYTTLRPFQRQRSLLTLFIHDIIHNSSVFSFHSFLTLAAGYEPVLFGPNCWPLTSSMWTMASFWLPNMKC